MTPSSSKKELIQALVIAALTLYCGWLLFAILTKLLAPMPTYYRFTTSRSAYAQGRVLIVKDNCGDGCGTYVFVEDPVGTLKDVGEYNSELNHMLNTLVWSKDKTVFAVCSTYKMQKPDFSAAYDFTLHQFVSGNIDRLLTQRGGKNPPIYDDEAGEDDAHWDALRLEQFEAMRHAAS